MKRKRNRSESNYVRRKINRWTRFLAKVIVSVNRYHRSARIGTIIAEEPVPL